MMNKIDLGVECGVPMTVAEDAGKKQRRRFKDAEMKMELRLPRRRMR